LAEKLVNKGGFAMIDVRDDGDITQGHSIQPHGSGAQKRRMLRAPLA
jgi:hypothetical protein